jgi:hypothetical protein
MAAFVVSGLIDDHSGFSHGETAPAATVPDHLH